MPTVRVLCCGPLRAACGDTLAIELPAAADGRALLAALATRQPSLAGLIGVSRLAAGDAFLDLAAPLPADAEVVVIPPVSGG